MRQQRILHSRLRETLCAQQAGIATAARFSLRSRIIATAGNREVDAERCARFDDTGFAQLDQRGVDFELVCTLHSGFRRQVGHPLERLDVFGPTVRIARVIERVDADEDIA